MRYVAFCCIWWFFWIFIWQYNSEIEFSMYAKYMLVSFPISIFFGSLVARRFCISKNIEAPKSHRFEFSDSLFTKSVLGFGAVLCLINAFLATETYHLIQEGLSFGQVRNLYFGINGNGSWFGNQLFEFLYNTSYAVFSILLMIVAIVLYLNRKKGWAIYFSLSFFLLITSSFSKGGRGEIYGLILLFLIVFFVDYRVFTKNKKFFLGLISFISLALVLAAFISYDRAGNIIETFFIYHSIGFTLFSEYVKSDVHGISNLFGAQFGFVAGIDYLYSLFIRYLSHQNYINTIFLQMKIEAQNVVIAHKYCDNGELCFQMYNTFYTLVSSLYKSGGAGGVILGGGALGFYIQFVTFKNNSIYSKIIATYLSYFICMGIFASPLELPAFFLGLVFINLLYTFTSYKCRHGKLERVSK